MEAGSLSLPPLIYTPALVAQLKEANMTQAVAIQTESPPPAVVSESAAILQIIERAAANPNVDIDKMERLLEMQERIHARNAKMAYDSAFAEMQPKIPVIDQKGRITITEKNNPNNVIQSTPYALMADINDAIKPILAEFGFSLSHRTGTTPEGKISITGILSHRGGHREETSIVLMHDSSGSKNSVQAVGSSIAYGIRYTTRMLLNISSRAPQDLKDDDDGRATGADNITDEQISALQALAIEVGADLPKFYAYLKIQTLADLPAKDYARAVSALNAKRARA